MVATPEELRREFGFDSCSDDVCSRELEALRLVFGSVKEAISPTSPVHVGAEATLVSVAISVPADEAIVSVPGSNLMEPHSPVETGRVARMLKLRRARKI